MFANVESWVSYEGLDRIRHCFAVPIPKSEAVIITSAKHLRESSHASNSKATSTSCGIPANHDRVGASIPPLHSEAAARVNHERVKPRLKWKILFVGLEHGNL